MLDRLGRANERLWPGLHPDGVAAVYGDEPAVAGVASADNRLEVLDAPDPLQAIQRVHWEISRAAEAYQSTAEEQRQLAADVGELVCEFVDSLVGAGWIAHDARTTNVHDLAGDAPA
jgi:hypothetical protein